MTPISVRKLLRKNTKKCIQKIWKRRGGGKNWVETFLKKIFGKKFLDFRKKGGKDSQIKMKICGIFLLNFSKKPNAS